MARETAKRGKPTLASSPAENPMDAPYHEARPESDTRSVPMGSFVPRMVTLLTIERTDRTDKGSRYVRNSPGGVCCVVLIPPHIRSTQFI